MKNSSLFSPLQVGPYTLAHRVVLAPLTRMRADKASFAPRRLNADYYAQRATSGGLLIAEASPVLPTGRGNPATPGIYSAEQIAGWRQVTDAVHAKGGRMFAQFCHLVHAAFRRLFLFPLASAFCLVLLSLLPCVFFLAFRKG